MNRFVVVALMLFVPLTAVAGNLLETLRPVVVERFLRYAPIDTQSKYDVEKIPSTPGQLELGKKLEAELKALGLLDTRIDSQGYVYATLPAAGVKHPEKIPVIGFICHLDTSDAVPGNGVKPIVHKNYQGGDIVLPKNSTVIKAEKNTNLKKSKGSDIITSDGSTLLGADDKAGVAELMTAVEYLLKHPEIPHGTVKIAFSPDEEIDKGPAFFDIKSFGASFAYTVDGCEEGELNWENFNAASATVYFHGKNSHPGDAKGNMVNTLYALSQFISSIPQDKRPENSDERQGFLHPYDIRGDEEQASVRILLRDFEKNGMAEKKATLAGLVEKTKALFPEVKTQLIVADTYSNMKEILASSPQVMEYAREAMKRAGVVPVEKPIRGGTDGADFSFMGLPCANIFSGSESEHSCGEWVAADTMAKATETIIHLVSVWAERSSPGEKR